MKKLDSYDLEVLEKDVERYVKAFNSWDDKTKIAHALDGASIEDQVLCTAIYVMGWKFNLETEKYER